jgi:D-3-phosphoglycerate dehydrogenase
MRAVNNVLLHHNIEKQMSDSRGEVAYLMADISDVKEEEIRDLFQSLEELSCKYYFLSNTQIG